MADDKVVTAINTLAKEIEGVGCRIAEDSPLNYAIGIAGSNIQEGLNKIGDNIDTCGNGLYHSLCDIAEALNNIADALYKLGLGNASTPMGAIEALSFEVKEGLKIIAERK